MAVNDEYRNRAALDNLDAARKLARRHASAIGNVSNVEVAVLLGRLIRGVEELSIRIERLGGALSSRLTPDVD